MRTKLSFYTLLILLCALLVQCTFVQERYPQLPPGPYRGVLKLENNFASPNPKGQPLPEKVNLKFEEVMDGELPFTFNVAYDTDSSFYLDIINGEETIRVPAENISYGRDQRQGRDTLRIDFPVFDSYISAYHEENVIEGVWVVNYRPNYRIPFVAEFGKNHRFTQLRKEPITDLSGNWALTFGPDEDGYYPALGEFQQVGNRLTGTIRTETGDYRYLEGTVQADKFYLSVFDGSHAFLFEGKIGPDGQQLAGSFRSGRHYLTAFTGQRDADYVLPDPDSLTKLREDSPISFSFPNAKGKIVSINDPEFQGKVRLVNIMGTWCPNCRDETNYLKQYLADHPAQEIKVISLAFERYGSDDPRSLDAIIRYQENMEIDWPVLLAGGYDIQEATNKLPMLDKVISYPTLLFIDKQGTVRRIHTGFNGPATSAFEDFDRSFKSTVETLLAEDDPSK